MKTFIEEFRDDWIQFFELSHDGIIVADGEGRIVYMNPASERLEEVGKDYIIGKQASELEREGIYEVSVTVKTLKDQKPVTLMQYKGGKQLVITGVPFFENGRIKWIFINERDVTELSTVKRDSEMIREIAEKYKRQLDIIQDSESEYISKSPIMERTMDLLERIATADISVILSGESGVGKDVYARWIHNHSLRKEKPFMKIDCGALTESLLESELFGYEKGAFTGASEKGKKGLVEVAAGGTLFLDEIGEMPLNLQAKLLRLVQENVFIPVGGVTAKKVDIRIIAATNKDLEKMVEENLFRQDLYYRLNVVPLTIPSLRERKEDIFYFVRYFLNKFNMKHGFHKTISSRAVNSLCQYDWPGNVRELSNIIERLVVVTPSSTIDASDVAVILSPKQDFFLERKELSEDNYQDALEEFEARYFAGIFETGKTLEEMARHTGISMSTLKRKLNKYNLRKNKRAKKV